jgi:hypothetical protein
MLGRLVLDHKTIAGFRKDNGLVLREVCARFEAVADRGYFSSSVISRAMRRHHANSAPAANVGRQIGGRLPRVQPFRR